MSLTTMGAGCTDSKYAYPVARLIFPASTFLWFVVWRNIDRCMGALLASSMDSVSKALSFSAEDNIQEKELPRTGVSH